MLVRHGIRITNNKSIESAILWLFWIIAALDGLIPLVPLNGVKVRSIVERFTRLIAEKHKWLFSSSEKHGVYFHRVDMVLHVHFHLRRCSLCQLLTDGWNPHMGAFESFSQDYTHLFGFMKERSEAAVA